MGRNNNKMFGLERFLRSCETTDSTDYNFVSLNKRKYKITDGDKLKKHYLKSFTKFSSTRCTQLIPKNKGLTPIHIDIDLRLSSETIIPNSAFIEVAKLICEQAEIPGVEVVITRRVAGYFDPKTKKMKHGCHIYLAARRSKDFQMKLRAKCLKNIDWGKQFDKYNNFEKPEKIYDVAIPRKSNDLMMIGDYKKGKVASPHFVCFCGRWNDGWVNEKHVTYEESTKVFRDIYDILYGWIFDPKKEPTEDIRVAIAKPTKTKNRVMNQGDEKRPEPSPSGGGCDARLAKFIDAFPVDWIPDNETYVQIVYFLKKMNLDPAKTCDLLNQKWGYATRETEKMMRKANDLPQVSVGSMVRILNLHGKPSWKREDIFEDIAKEERKFQYFNEVLQFTGYQKANKLEDIFQFFRDVIQYTWGESTTRFVYRETHEIRDYDRPIQVVNICVTQKSPFDQFSDRLIKCELTVQETIDRLKVLLKRPKRPKDGTSDDIANFEQQLKFVTEGLRLVAKIKKEERPEDIERAREILQKLLGKEIACKEHRLSELFKKYHQRGRLERYYKFDCVPFSLHGDSTPPHTLNVFTGFPLSKVDFKPIDIKQTNIWQWLWIAWANRSDYKMNWLLNAFAIKLQRPDKKLNKFIVAYSIETGSGKTTIRYFLQALFDSVFFCEALKNLTGEFSSQQLGKQWCVIDDIEKFSKAQSASLKGRITSTTFEYRKMYADPVRMNCYMDLIASSNSPSPVFIGTNDRRSELVEINPELKGNREFWDSVYEEFKSTDVMASWYHELLKRDLTDVSFGENYRFSHDAIATQKVQNLRSAYRFLMTYFERSDWQENELAYNRSGDFLHDMIDSHIKVSGSDLIITTVKLYEFYRRWVKLCGERNQLKMTNFMQELTGLGIRKTRQRLNGVRKSVFILSGDEIKRLIARHLSVDVRYIEMEWSLARTERQIMAEAAFQ